jgi:hypothetical protein
MAGYPSRKSRLAPRGDPSIDQDRTEEAAEVMNAKGAADEVGAGSCRTCPLTRHGLDVGAPFGVAPPLEHLGNVACQPLSVRRLDLGDGISDLIVDPRLAQHALGDLGADLGLDLLGQLLR